ncbi:DNA glycosylase AlkZ-like family protein, partial [Burkholderia multivorans]|uniref:DNA glycosylase AlkZ-like family protein n=1 Tax=Burkholderia multivorans TaxID=87883 RepID=UPI000DB0F5F8
PYIALWSRLSDFTRSDLQEALERRSVVRATLMRSTLHLVASADYAAYDSATGADRKAVWSSTARKAGIDLEAVHRALLASSDEPRTVDEME